MDTTHRVLQFPNGQRPRQAKERWCRPRTWNVRLLFAADRDSGAESEGVVSILVHADNTWEVSVQTKPDIPALTLVGDERSSTAILLREVFTHLFRIA